MTRLHLVSLPHTQVSSSFCCCAYTSKVLKFCKMMKRDYEILLYAPDGPPVDGAALIPCLSHSRRREIFGRDDPHRLAIWPTPEQTAEFNAGVIAGLLRNVKPRELILISGGRTHSPIMAAFPNHLFCEPFCGYEGICTDRVAFESYAHQNRVYALKNIGNGRWFDAVIPNFFDREEFLVSPIPPANDPPYLLFLGRVVERKGPHIAGLIAEKLKMTLVVAGPGAKQVGPDVVAAEVTIKNATYAGTADIAKRAELLAGATALIAPTIYLEPFGGVAVEAMMAGCPVITTDWGAFPETVDASVGARFRNLAEGVAAVEKVRGLDREKIQQYARERFSLEAVRPMFKRWFEQINTMWGKGWYEGV
jgi:glycosyltransferase involved in cell wall biosynthesis